MHSEMYIAEGVIPSALPVLEPMVMRIGDVLEQPDMFGVTPEHAYTGRLLDAAADVYSRWFIVMRSAISRERVRQRIQCEDKGLSADTKIPYERPVLTAAESYTVSFCEAMVRSLFDPKVAEYAMMKFRRAIDTGDKRSFKIRLLVLKSRDSLKGTRLYNGFSDGSEECISKAEKIAGCIPDPSPRRMSKAEQAKALARKNSPKQPTLFDCTPYENNNSNPDNSRDADTGRETAKHIDSINTDTEFQIAPHTSGIVAPVGGKPKGATAPTGSVTNYEKKASANNSKLDAEPVGAGGADANARSHVGTDGISKGIDKETSRKNGKVKKIFRNSVDKNVTVTKQEKVTLTPADRKTYSSTSEIAADIDSGKITAYDSNEEVIRDVKSGKITPSQAVLFLSELAKRKRMQSMSRIGDAISMDIDSRLGMASEDQNSYKCRISMSDIDDDLFDDDDNEDMDLEDAEDLDEQEDRFEDIGGEYD